ncbi:pilin [Lentzea sp. BCCO 10_0856]|uniref:Pilin n=1 Tax=Lentzea miocenica TaxID=3095431 RepID=A0ABU4T102_9PSEU|nr:pilin [Lentzea sp. BCCO 10_0856]MDX8031692.1 pilin [Lentzea sp. BCCO 10_0856]
MRLIDRFCATASGSRDALEADGPQSTTLTNWSRIAVAAGAVVLVLLASASVAGADTMVVALAKSVDEVLNNIRNWIMGILAGLATVFLSIGGARWIVGGNDPGEVEKAKSAFRSAGWGYGLAALAPLVVEILKGIVGA